jgi:hypothetical protein
MTISISLTRRISYATRSRAVKIEVYQDCQHSWCVSDGNNQAEGERAYAELIAKALI